MGFIYYFDNHTIKCNCSLLIIFSMVLILSYDNIIMSFDSYLTNSNTSIVVKSVAGGGDYYDTSATLVVCTICFGTSIEPILFVLIKNIIDSIRTYSNIAIVVTSITGGGDYYDTSAASCCSVVHLFLIKILIHCI